MNLKLRACRTEQERQKLILDTLYPAYKAQAEQYKENAKNVMEANAAQDKLNGAMAKLGEIGEPILTGVKGWIADMVNAAVPHLETLVEKLADFDTTMETEVWPWIQQEAKMKFGIELPDWDTFKSDAQTWWTNTKANISTLMDDAKFMIRCLGFGEWTDEDTERLRGWWDGVYAKAVEICKWLIDPPELPDPDALVAAITSWWNGIRSRLNLTFGVKAQTYAGNLAGVSTGSAVGDAYVQATMTNPDAPWAAGLKNLFNWKSSNAVGLDRVPRDGYLIRAHKDETLLNKAEADAYYGSNKVEALLTQLVANTSGGQMVVLDSGVLVGQIASKMDTRLGTIGNRKGRGN